MTKDEFNLLIVDKQVKEINALVRMNGSLTKACDKLNISRTTLRNRFKKSGYEFCKYCNKYVKSEEHKCNTDRTQLNESIKSNIKHNENTGILLSDDSIKKKFIWIMNNFNTLETIINERMQIEHSCNTNIIEVKHSEFLIDLPDSKTHHTTIRINKVIWDEFNKLYNLKYKHLNKADILSMSLKQFIDKHK